MITRIHSVPYGIPSRGRSAGAMKLGFVDRFRLAEACYSRDHVHGTESRSVVQLCAACTNHDEGRPVAWLPTCKSQAFASHNVPLWSVLLVATLASTGKIPYEEELC